MHFLKLLFKNRTQVFLCIFATLIWYYSRNLIIDLSGYLSNKCDSAVPPSSYANLLSGLVCGANLQKNESTNLLKTFSLTHLIVVSGSHFVLLEQLLNLANLSKWTLPISWAFNLVTGFQPPGTRSVVEMSLRYLFKKKSLSYPKELVILISWIITITLMPEWLLSLSLFLSTMCAILLAIRLPGIPKILDQIFRPGFLFCVFSWCFFDNKLSLTGWLVNQVITLAVSVLAFPLALLSWFLPVFTFLFDGVWRYSFWLMTYFKIGDPPHDPYIIEVNSLYRIALLIVSLIFLSLWNPADRGKKWN